MNFEISLAKTEADLAEVIALDRMLDADMVRFLPDFFDPGAFSRNYEGYLDGARGFAFLARAEGEAVGMARCVLGNVAMLESLFVVEAFRGQGVGSALLKVAREMSLARGQKVMMLNVLSGNGGARRLYEREGFSDFRATMIVEL
jgi:GNAT superfamily N-acetyltransferase